jgi:hypothetical protein
VNPSKDGAVVHVRGGTDAAPGIAAVIVARLHALVRRRELERLPRIDETPAFRKLALGNLSPQLSLLVLDESRCHIQDVRAALL